MTYPGWRWDGTQWQRAPMTKKRTGLVVTLALLIPAVVILLCVGGAIAVFSGSDTEPRAAGAGQETEEGLTTDGRDGQFEFTVLEVERGVPPADEFWSEEAQGEYVAVTLRVENIGDAPRELDSDEQRLYDSDGREYKAAWGIGEWQYETVNPGNSLEVVIYYDVPVEAELVRMELHDSMWSSGVDVGLPG
jgi:hypothetical protein